MEELAGKCGARKRDFCIELEILFARISRRTLPVRMKNTLGCGTGVLSI